MQKITVKILNGSAQSEQNLNKIVGLIEPKSVANLISNASLDANPRLSKTGKVTDAIIESLEKTPELFMFKSKGILVSTMDCEELDRSRFRISFETGEVEGILDGGHNTLAMGIHLLNKANPENDLKIKTWDDLLIAWKNQGNIDEIRKYLDGMDDSERFLVPFELIYPEENKKDQYIDNILEISAARNNNAELAVAAKANHAGFYNRLREELDPIIAEKVEWKTNEPGKSIKAQDIVSLALIPMMPLEDSGLLKTNNKINKVSLYSSKGQCVKTFNDIVEAHSTRNEDGDLIIKDSYIISALEIMKDIPKIYDMIYEQFPDAYNRKSSRFGGINAVTKHEGSGRQPLSKFYREKVNYKYPDGYIYPIIASLNSLLEVKDGRVAWKVKNPCAFLEMNLGEITDLLIGHIKTHGYNPQSVGKDTQSYKLIEVMINVLLAKHQG